MKDQAAVARCRTLIARAHKQTELSAYTVLSALRAQGKKPTLDAITRYLTNPG